MEHLGIELVDRLAGERALLDRGIDLGRAQPGGQKVAGDLWQLLRRRRVVALVGDGDKVGAESEREQHLGRGWDEADDSHMRGG